MDIINADITKVRETISSYIDNDILNGAIKDFILGTSKMVRSVVTILFLKSFGIELTHSAFGVLAAGEIIHNASLLHDDVIDEAAIRRGNTTIHNLFNNKISILAGDYLLGCATECLISTNDLQIIHKFKDCTQKMCIGEFNQFFLRGKLPTFDEYIEICKNKTGNLFATILEAATTQKKELGKKAYNFGEKFGILFQINNDLQTDSAITDAKNCIYTIKDIIGIEKTEILSDNYKKELEKIILDAPNNVFKEGLEDLIRKL